MEIVWYAMCCSSIAFTMSVTSIFKWFRELISPIHSKLEELIHCPWCLSHWIIAVFLLIKEDSYLQPFRYGLLNFAATLFTMTCISGLCHYVLLRAYEPVAKAMAQRKIEKLNITQNGKRAVGKNSRNDVTHK